MKIQNTTLETSKLTKRREYITADWDLCVTNGPPTRTLLGTRPSCWCRWSVPCSTTGCRRRADRPRSEPRDDACPSLLQGLGKKEKREPDQPTLFGSRSIAELCQVSTVTEDEEKPSPSTFTRCGPRDAIACEGETKLEKVESKLWSRFLFFLNTFLIAVQSSRMSRSCSM